MKNLIYYPSFEPSNADWIKFALLYIDKLNPIIPYSGDKYLTDITSKLSKETDLIEIHRPSYEEGNRATINALNEIDKILRNPQRYNGIFKNSHILSQWRQRINFTHELFEDKYTPEFKKFILSQRFGIKNGDNILIPKELAHIYMSILAQDVSSERGISPITDNENLYAYSIFTKQACSQGNNNINIAHHIINLVLPDNIHNISLDRFIQFRNRRGFKERQSAFHEELNNYLTKLENNANAEEFINKYRHTLAEFTGDFVDLWPQVIWVSLGTWLLSTSHSVVIYDAIQHLLGCISVGGSIISIVNSSRTPRYCKKYLLKLSEI